MVVTVAPRPARKIRRGVARRLSRLESAAAVRPTGATSHAGRWQRPTAPAMVGGMYETRTSLILRVADAQDHQAWNEFSELYSPLLFGHFRKMGIREHDARDLLQELLIKLLDRVGAYERSRGRFRTWLWSVATRHAIDWMRSVGRRRAVEEAVYDQWSATQDWQHDRPDHVFETAYRQRVIRFACERVREERERTEAGRRMWRCFEQYWLNGRPAGDVAADLKIDNENNVRVYAMRVLERVRSKCNDYDPELREEAM